eukprot:GILI01011111.1.p1 GENE.GILI01011111.1~~GILI01011111.1.p1  ORF type:complete len:540 (-),score=86.61 GILI01011111.1:58-1677(-)
MEFTPQQMGGYKGYSAGVLVGNWSEELAVREDKMRRFQATMEATKGSVRMGSAATDPKLQLMQRVQLGPSSPERYLQFGVPVMIRNGAAGGCISIDTTPRNRPMLNHARVTCVADDTPVVRSTWILSKAKDYNNAFYDSEGESSVVHYGQYIRIVNELASSEGAFSLSSRQKSANNQYPDSKRQEVTACLGGSNDCLFVIEQSDGKALTCPLDGHPVRVGEKVVLRHKVTNKPLVCEPQYRATTTFGAEFELAAELVKPQFTNTSAITHTGNFFTFVAGAPGSQFVPYNLGATQSALQRVKERILSRGNATYVALQRAFRTFDDNHNRLLSRKELKEGLDIIGLPLTTSELDAVFKEFDTDGNGGISLEEFLGSLRGPMNQRRESLVMEAFQRLDRDGSGVVSLEELFAIYGANLPNHPQVMSGNKSPEQILREFTAQWDGNRDGSITAKEFMAYYDSISAGIDDDNYFELLIRNAWRIDGGQGVSANTANRRVLVTYNDGRQEVIGLKNDLGVGADKKKIVEQLKAQGVTNIKQVDLN